MILGTVTVYQCDSVACDATAIVPVEREEEYQVKWHLGHTHHFCPSCKLKVDNAADIHEDEEIQRRFEKADVIDFRPSGRGGRHAA